MEFYSYFNKPKRKQQSFTNTKQKVYKATFDKHGKRNLVVDSEIDIYDKIQEYKDDCSLTNMFSKYGLSIYDQLKDKEEQLVDLTNLPTNLMETMEIIDNAKHAFDVQSTAIKAKFNNNFKEFLAGAENGQLAKLLNEELKVSQEKFKTANMANFDAQNVQLQSYNTQVEQPAMQNTQQTQVQQPVQNTQQGVNLNV